MKKNLILAVVVSAFTLAASAYAGDAVMSPKAQELADSLKMAPGSTPDMLDRSLKSAPPKVVAMRESLRTVPSAGPTVDLAHAPRPTMSPKDPQFEMAWRSNAMMQSDIQVAPLK
ncbi:MAG TPA: hypothetical protein VN873_13580 [Candidatus Angelobacter sp.]|nr:hypothetical protein [Candidatus Angelobacter sp.]